VRKRSLSPLTLVCIGCITLNALMFVTVGALIGFDSDGLFLLIPAGALLLMAGLVVTGYRWAPLVPGILGPLQVVTVIFVPYISYHLTQPQPEFPFFVAIMFMIGCWIMEGVTGIGATVQNYQTRERKLPRWFPTVIAGATGIVLGAILIGAILQPGTNTTTSASNGVVHMGPGNFVQSTVNVQKGSKLQIIDDGAFLHVLSNGSYQNNVATPVKEAGAPTISNLNVNGGTIQVGPFNTAATFHIFCSIHAGMQLTIIVK
jgi:plastocyanin